MFDEDNLSALDTINDFLRFALTVFNQNDLFYGHGTDNSWDEAVSLVLGMLSLPWDVDKGLLNGRLTANEKGDLVRAIQRRVIDRVPVPYITGTSWFMGLPFNVTTEVIIPRSPLAELLGNRMEPWLDREPERILDLCCGSACIGIGAASVFNEAEVVASDISTEALTVAASNIQKHQLNDQVNLVQSDLLQSVPGRFDLILANPPYVDEQDMHDLPAEYRHEPRLALAAGDDGLDLCRRILADALDYLQPGGLLVCEVGNSLDALLTLFPEVAFICPDFEHGGTGVFVLTDKELKNYRDVFKSALR